MGLLRSVRALPTSLCVEQIHVTATLQGMNQDIFRRAKPCGGTFRLSCPLADLVGVREGPCEQFLMRVVGPERLERFPLRSRRTRRTRQLHPGSTCLRPVPRLGASKVDRIPKDAFDGLIGSVW